MDTVSQYKEYARKTRYKKGKKLNKSEMADIVKGINTMNNLGIFNKPNWDMGRKR